MKVFGSTNAAALPKTAPSKSTSSYLDSTNLKVFLLVVGTLLVTASLSVWQMQVAGAGNWISITTGCVGGLLVLAVALKTLHTYIQNRKANPPPSSTKATSHAKPKAAAAAVNTAENTNQAINHLISNIGNGSIKVEQVIQGMRAKNWNCSSRTPEKGSIIEAATKAKNAKLVKALLENFPIDMTDIGTCIDLALALDTDMKNKCAILVCFEEAHAELDTESPAVSAIVNSIPKRLVDQAIKASDLQALETIFESFELEAKETKDALATVAGMTDPARAQFIAVLRKEAAVACIERIKEDEEPQEVIDFITLLGLDVEEECKRAIRHGSLETLKAIILVKKVAVKSELIAYAEENASKDNKKRTNLKPQMISYLQQAQRG